jgi:glycosyltransferase involved in cell wall biosynthesis
MNQYFPGIQRAGHKIVCSSLLPNSYITKFQAGSAAPFDIFRGYLLRVFTILKSGRFDLIWIEKECLPWLPAGLELAMLSGQVPFALDYDDAEFHKYDTHRSQLVRHFLSSKHRKIMRMASLITAGNKYLAGYARESGGQNIEIVPTVVDLERYKSIKPSNVKRTQVPTVGWIGQKSTAKYLLSLTRILTQISAEGSAKFLAIGLPQSYGDLPIDRCEWSELSENDDILRFDIGIMPLQNGPYERGKCGYKLIQYMACGLPVVASPVGVNKEIVDHGVNGFLAETAEEWHSSLIKLIRDPSLRHHMGLAGRKKIERLYSLESLTPRLIEVLEDAAPRTI